MGKPDEELRTGNTGQELTRKTLDLTAWKRYEGICLEKVKNALTEKIRDNADVVPVVEAISEVNASIPVLLVIGGQR